MKAAQRLTIVAGLLVASPALAADLRIPPPLDPAPTRASFPFDRQPAPIAPTTVIPTVPDVAKEAPPPPPAFRDPASGEDPSAPTWLDRFGPFLKSQLDIIFTGSITPREEESRCEPGKKFTHATANRCEKSKPRRAQPAAQTAPAPVRKQTGPRPPRASHTSVVPGPVPQQASMPLPPVQAPY